MLWVARQRQAFSSEPQRPRWLHRPQCLLCWKTGVMKPGNWF